MNCPFLSSRGLITRSDPSSGNQACNHSCALYVNGTCAFTVIATELMKANAENHEVKS